MTLYIKKCMFCKKEFKTSAPFQMTCGDEQCKNKLTDEYNNQRKKGDWKNFKRECVHCNKEFIPDYFSQVTCCEQCKLDRRKKVMNGYTQKHYRHNKQKKTEQVMTWRKENPHKYKKIKDVYKKRYKNHEEYMKSYHMYNYNEICSVCAEGRVIEYHHIIPQASNKNNTDIYNNDNVIPLCPTCHSIITRKKGYLVKTINGYDIVKEKDHVNRINKIIIDSVIYTMEGITAHIRNECIEFHKAGYEICLLDNYKYNKNIDNCTIFKNFYKPIDVLKEDYFTIVNQPPTRWANTGYLKNRIAYLAFEGNLPDDWVQIINNSRILQLWTPSEYCKEKFIESGVTVPIKVVPHGVSDKYKPINIRTKGNKLRLLWSGAPNSKRKNIEFMLEGFVKAYKDNPNVTLIIKVNKIYDQTFDVNKVVSKIVPDYMLQQIQYMDDDVTEEDMIQLFNSVDAYVSTSYSEGFGMQILESLACGTPVITTCGTGQDQMINDKNIKGILSVKNTNKEIWAPLIPPYNNVKWIKPDLNNFIEQLKYIGDDKNYNKLKKECLSSVDYIHKNWSWKNIVELMEKTIKNI